jgi:hypothetical protein
MLYKTIVVIISALFLNCINRNWSQWHVWLYFVCVCLQGGVNTCVRHGGIYVKSIVPGSAADLDENIKKGKNSTTSLLEVIITDLWHQCRVMPA